MPPKATMNKKAIWSELVVIIIVLIVFLGAGTAFGKLVKNTLFDESPEDTETLQHFENLVDEINMLLEDDSITATKTMVPMYISNNYVVLAFNSEEDSTNVFFCHNDLKVDTREIFRPGACQGTCLCLLRRKSDSHGAFFSVYDFNKIDCRSFPEDTFIYSLTDYSYVFRTLTYESYVEQGGGAYKDESSIEVYPFSIHNNNYGSGIVHDFKPLDNLEHPYDREDPEAYSHLFFGPLPYEGNWQICPGRDDFFGRKFLYLNKIDFSKFSDKYSQGNKKKYIFIVRDDSGERGENVFKYRERILSSLTSRSSDKYKNLIFSSENDYFKMYYFLDYLQWAVNPLLFDAREAESNLLELDLDALRAVRQAIKNRIVQCGEDPLLECSRTYVDVCDSSLVGESNVESCKNIMMLKDIGDNKYVDDYKAFYVRMVGEETYKVLETEYMGLIAAEDFFQPRIVLDLINKLISRLDPKQEAELLQKAREKEEVEDYYKAYKLYLEFIEDHKDEFYQEDGTINVDLIGMEYPTLHPLKGALRLLNLMGEAELIKKGLDADNSIYVFDFGQWEYAIVPSTKQYGLLQSSWANIVSTDDQAIASLPKMDLETMPDRRDIYVALQLLMTIDEKGCIEFHEGESLFSFRDLPDDNCQKATVYPFTQPSPSTQPASTQPASTQPAATQPASTQPASTQPAQPSTQPAEE